jgi:hypothetical protein
MLFCFTTLYAEMVDKADDKSEDSTAYETLPYNREVLLKKINRRIDKLQMSYISQLYKSERYEAQILLDEIRKVANLLAYTAPVAPQVITIKEAPQVVINVAPPEPPAPKLRAMNNEDFLDLKQSIRKNNFGDSGLNTLRSAAEGNYFKSSQIVDIMSLFVFSDDKLKALAITYPKCLDTQSKYKILDAFLFDSDKKTAQEIMSKVKN